MYAHPSRFEARFNLGKNGEGIFGAGIVAGGNNEVASLARRLSHLWPLGAVTVAPASKERDDAAAGLRGELAGQDDKVAQSIVGVGVVHDHREWLAASTG